MKIVEIEWVDSNHAPGWTEIEETVLFINSLSLKAKTVGYLFAEDDEQVSVVQSVAWKYKEDGAPSSVDGVMTIPKAAIIKRRVLK